MTAKSHPQQIATDPDQPSEQAPSLAFLTQSHSNGLRRLHNTFAENRPLAVLIAEGHSASSFVIQGFLEDLDEEVSVVRITEPCAGAAEFMGKIIEAVGFDPKDLRLEDLDSIFRMFLSFQKSHGRRTVLCVEETQDSDWWVLDKIRNLVELEGDGQFGLMVLIAGRGRLKELLYERPLNAISDSGSPRITLLPFTLAETREYIRRRVEGAGTASVDQVLDFDAITLIHDLAEGIPDVISALLSQCLDMADQLGGIAVTTELVNRANEVVRVASVAAACDFGATTVNLDGLQPRIGRLIVQLSGDDVRELSLGQGHVLIGRSKLCDIRVDSLAVSRQHALIVYSTESITLVDLSSTNGTFVDGYQVQQHELSPGESIVVGDCTIEYILDDRGAGNARVHG